jgi:hypothetical protein
MTQYVPKVKASSLVVLPSVLSYVSFDGRELCDGQQLAQASSEKTRGDSSPNTYLPNSVIDSDRTHQKEPQPQ